MTLHQQIASLQGEIASLLARYPELAEDEDLRADMLEGETDLHAVIEKLLGMAREAESMCEAIAARRGALGERLVRYEAKELAMREIIQTLMDRAGLQKLQLPEATLSISYRKPSPVVTDEAALPDEFCKIVRKPDMAKIKEAETLPPGVAMGNGKSVLTIRTR